MSDSRGWAGWHGTDADINMRQDALNVDERVEYELEECKCSKW